MDGVSGVGGCYLFDSCTLYNGLHQRATLRHLFAQKPNMILLLLQTSGMILVF
jgi:hypothetical protein